MPGGPLSVLGATGFTGRLCAAVAAHGHLPLVLAGRDRKGLEALARRLATASGTRAEVRVVDVADADALTSLAADSGAVLSTVGPYARLGAAVVDAAIEGGGHLVDVSGELDYIRAVHARDAEAAVAGVTLCPAAGFDGAPGELLAGIAAAALGVPPSQARTATMASGVRVSRGTARSALGIGADHGAAVVAGEVVAEHVAARTWTAPFPQPVGPRAAVSVPGPEIVALRRSLAVTSARAHLVVPGAWLWGAAAPPLGWLGRLGAATPLWRALGAAVDRLPEGPSAPQRAGARTAVLAEVTAGDRRAGAWAALPDPYEVTARLAVAVAERLRAGEGAPGVRTPLEVFGTTAAGGMLDAAGGRWERLPG